MSNEKITSDMNLEELKTQAKQIKGLLIFFLVVIGLLVITDIYKLFNGDYKLRSYLALLFLPWINNNWSKLKEIKAEIEARA